MSVYDFTCTTMQGKEVSLSQYKGKVILIVNTASKCGFTPQFAGLEKSRNSARSTMALPSRCSRRATYAVTTRSLSSLT